MRVKAVLIPKDIEGSGYWTAKYREYVVCPYCACPNWVTFLLLSLLSLRSVRLSVLSGGLCPSLKVFLSGGDENFDQQSKLRNISKSPPKKIIIYLDVKYFVRFIWWNIHPARAGPVGGWPGLEPESPLRARLEHSTLHTQLSRGLRLWEWRLSANILIRKERIYHHRVELLIWDIFRWVEKTLKTLRAPPLPQTKTHICKV